MTVIYFTDGALIEDVCLRRSLLRIPEIIETLRKSQSEFIDHDLFLTMNLEESYERMNYAQKRHLTNILQTALFERWKKKSTKYDLVIRRQDHPRLEDLKDLFMKLASLEKLKVITIGPGFDQLETFLRTKLQVKSLPIFDAIQLDPALDWFWQDYRSSIQLHS